MSKQLDVQIMGQSYILGCPEGGEERLMSAVYRVDEAMCKIRDAGKIKARDRIAVLAALNLAFDQSNTSNVPPEETNTPQADEATTSAQARLNQVLARLDQVLLQEGQLI
jgi:cell division protein ZapA